MQWLTIPDAKAKARWERIGCRAGRKLVLPGEFTSTTEAFPLGDSPEPVRVQPLGSGSRRIERAPPPAPEASMTEPPAPEAASAEEEPELPHQ